MSLFREKKVDCPAGEWTTIAATDASGMPRTYSFRFEGESVEGEVRVKKSMLPFGMGLEVAQTMALEPQLRIEQGWFDVSFRIEVKPVGSVHAVRE